LYLVDDDNPINKKIAEVAYNNAEGKFVSLIYNVGDYKAPLRDAQIDIPTKVEAMEAAMAMLVASRFDKAN
jgi:hypothetical protein